MLPALALVNELVHSRNSLQALYPMQKPPAACVAVEPRDCGSCERSWTLPVKTHPPFWKYSIKTINKNHTGCLPSGIILVPLGCIYSKHKFILFPLPWEWPLGYLEVLMWPPRHFCGQCRPGAGVLYFLLNYETMGKELFFLFFLSFQELKGWCAWRNGILSGSEQRQQLDLETHAGYPWVIWPSFSIKREVWRHKMRSFTGSSFSKRPLAKDSQMHYEIWMMLNEESYTLSMKVLRARSIPTYES